MRLGVRLLLLGLGLALSAPTIAKELAASRDGLSEYFPPTEEQGGWRTLLPQSGEPDSTRKAEILRVAGIDWDALKEAWTHNASAPGGTGLLVIRKGYVVGEWYGNAERTTAFNIYSSSKSYTSTAYGLVLADFDNPVPSGGKKITLDTAVCNAEWLPESLPLPDPRKEKITVRHLLNMTSGLGQEPVPQDKRPFEFALGHVEGSPFARLKSEPGETFHYSNAGVSHLVLVFQRAAGTDLYPFLKDRLFDPVGITQLRWQTIGGDGGLGPYNQGYSGIHTNPRQHARFCYLALHRGEWAGKRIVPARYYDFAWKGTAAKADYGAQWWVAPHYPKTPQDLVMTLGRDHNDGFVCPSLDLVFVRLGNGNKFPKNFDRDLVHKVLAAVR